MLCLRDEVAAFGVKCCIVVPGHFRTHILSPGKIVYSAKDIPDYAPANKMCEDAVVALDQNQPGDPYLGSVRIVDAVHSEGDAAGKELPFLLPLGQDAIDILRARSQTILSTCNEWETFAQKTTKQNPA